MPKEEEAKAVEILQPVTKDKKKTKKLEFTPEEAEILEPVARDKKKTKKQELISEEPEPTRKKKKQTKHEEEELTPEEKKELEQKLSEFKAKYKLSGAVLSQPRKSAAKILSQSSKPKPSQVSNNTLALLESQLLQSPRLSFNSI